MKPNGDLYPCSSWLSARRLIEHEMFTVQKFNVCIASLTQMVSSSSYRRMIQSCQDIASRNNFDICKDCEYSEVCKLCPISVLLLGEKVVENCRIAEREMEKLSLRADTLGPPNKVFPHIKRNLLWQWSDDILEVWKYTSEYGLKRQFKLNPVGKKIWEMINGNNHSFDDIVSALMPKRSCSTLSENEVLHDVVEFVNRLRFEGFVDVTRVE